MNALRWLFIVLFSSLTWSYDPSLSNGTCYYGAKKQAASGYIPCGNAAGGVQSCCQARDVCLSSNACFNGQYFVTYLAGCTDENYNDPSCPFKGQFADQQWVGLVRCGVSSGTGEEWGPCEESVQPKVNKGNTQCACDASRNTAVFTDAATLTNIASLPVSIGNAIAWFSGFTPSTTTTASGSTRTSSSYSNASTANTSQTVPSNVSASTTPLPASSSFSTAAKAGIGVGTVGGVLCVLGVLWLIARYRLRKIKAVLPIEDQIRPASMGTWSAGNEIFRTASLSAADTHRSWGGKSELPTEANEITTTKTSLGESTLQASATTPGTTYQPYQHSPITEANEMDGSPAASTSRLAPGQSAYNKPSYGGEIYEMPG